MSNTRATTPPMAPPAMAPALIFEVEEVVNELVVFPDVIDAATAAAADDDDDDADGSAEDWGGVVESATVVGEGVEEAPVVKGNSEMSDVGEDQEVSDVGEDQEVSDVEEEGVISEVVVGGGGELGMLVVTE